ncbi:hypothetical protein N9V90_02860, partial [Endozoicomonas sp.]|nr:hypothetical protein [Endozoicomonas sp.]
SIRVYQAASVLLLMCRIKTKTIKKSKSVMGKKRKFRKSLLSSAILAATLKTLSGEVVAGTCPLPNASGNVHVAPGSFCEGGVTVDSGTAVNDIGIEGKVVGNIVNDDGMSDFWMDFGTLDGSFINNGSAQDVHVANGSEIYADIRNNGDMRYLSITDGPGANTVVHGSIVNTGGVVRVHVEGMSTRVGGDIVNADGASVMNDIVVDGGAIVAGNIYNNGEASEVVVNRESSVEGDLISDGSAFGLAVLDGSSVGGDFVNNGDSFYFVADDGGTVGGSMINTGNNIYSGVLDGSTVVGDFGNEGFVDGVMMVSNATVQSNVYNETYNDGIQITDGSTVGGNVTNSGETGFMVTARSQIGGDFVNEGLTGHLGIYDSQIAGNVVNSDDSDFLLAIGDGSVVGGDLVNTDTGYIQDGIALLDGVTVEGSLINDGMLESSIQLVNGSSVGADLVNNGEVFVGPEGWQQLSDGSATVAGINVDAGSMVGGNIVNNDSLNITGVHKPATHSDRFHGIIAWCYAIRYLLLRVPLHATLNIVTTVSSRNRTRVNPVTCNRYVIYVITVITRCY